jgi:hypothetical protein
VGEIPLVYSKLHNYFVVFMQLLQGTSGSNWAKHTTFL